MSKKMAYTKPIGRESVFEKDPELVGIVTQFGKNDFSYWEGFSLTEEEKEQIQKIFQRHETEGYSVRGSRNDIAREIMG